MAEEVVEEPAAARETLSARIGSGRAANLATVWMAAITTVVGLTALLQISENNRGWAAHGYILYVFQ